MTDAGRDFTPASLLHHVEALLSERSRYFDQRLDAAEATLAAYAQAMERRFQSVNEFRAALSDQAALFVTRTEVEAVTNRNTHDLRDLADRFNTSEGRLAGHGSARDNERMNLGAILQVIALLLVVASLIVSIAIRP